MYGFEWYLKYRSNELNMVYMVLKYGLGLFQIGSFNRLELFLGYSTSTPVRGFTMGARPITEEGGGTYCREGKGEMVQKGEEKNQKGEGWGRSRRNMWRHPLAYSVARRAAPRRGERSDHKVELHSLRSSSTS